MSFCGHKFKAPGFAISSVLPSDIIHPKICLLISQYDISDTSFTATWLPTLYLNIHLSGYELQNPKATCTLVCIHTFARFWTDTLWKAQQSKSHWYLLHNLDYYCYLKQSRCRTLQRQTKVMELDHSTEPFTDFHKNSEVFFKVFGLGGVFLILINQAWIQSDSETGPKVTLSHDKFVSVNKL